MEINKTGKTPIFIENGMIYSVSLFDNNSVYLYNIYTPISIDEPMERFNINLEKLKKALSCISKENQFIDLKINNNVISYTDDSINANIKLIENSIIAVPKFNVQTFRNFEFIFNTKITKSKILEIKNAMNFASDTSKFYILMEDGKIYITFGDKQTSYADSIKVFLSSSYEGTINQGIYDTAILKLSTRFNEDMIMKIGASGALCIKIEQPNTELNYITTQLKK